MNRCQQETQIDEWEIKGRQLQKQFSGLFGMWKSFERSQTNLVKSYIGLNIFDTRENINLETYYDTLKKSKKKTIDRIFQQLEFINDRLELAQTYLYLSTNVVICVFRQKKNEEEVTFIDCNGRLYTSWKHFEETNELPNDYVAPEHGVYQKNGKITRFTSPAKRVSSNLCKAGDVVATGTIVGVVIVGAFGSFSVLFILGGICTAYGTLRGCHRLRDRYQHKQSIAFDNLESVILWANIGTTLIAGISSLALANAAEIVALPASEFSYLAVAALKGLNCLSFASSVLNFGVYLIYFQQKLRDGELSSMDLMQLCVNIFLVYGTVTNVRQMHRNLCKLEAEYAPNAISNSIKQELRDADDAGFHSFDVIEANASNSSQVTWYLFLLTTVDKILKEQFPSVYSVYRQCLDIKSTINDHKEKKLSFQDFAEHMTAHLRNLWQLIKEPFMKLKETIGSSFNTEAEASGPLTVEVTGIIHNGVLSLNSIDEEHPIPNAEDIHNLNSFDDSKPKYEIILQIVKLRVCQRNCTSETFLQTFTEELSLVIGEIMSKVEKDYGDWTSLISSQTGENVARTVVSNIRKSTYDFTNHSFTEIVENFKRSIGEIRIPVIIKTLSEKLFDHFHELFCVLSDGINPKKMSVQEICEIFQKLNSTFLEPLNEAFEDVKIRYRKYSERKNVAALRLLLNLKDLAVGKQPDDAMFLDQALKKSSTNVLDEIFDQISSMQNVKRDESEIFSDDYKFITLASLCNHFLRKIYPQLDSEDLEIRSTNTKKAYNFIVQAFFDDFQSLKNEKYNTAEISRMLSSLRPRFGDSGCIRVFKIVNETIKRELFDRIVEKFNREEFISELKLRYSVEMDHIEVFNVELCKNIVADDGMKIHYVNVQGLRSEEFRVKAAQMCNLCVSDIEVVNESDELIVFKSLEKYIIFKIMESGNEALVMQVDTLPGELMQNKDNVL